jgi:hypothetical protein
MILPESFSRFGNPSGLTFKRIFLAGDTMKPFKQLFATLVLVLILANAAPAEGIIYPWITPPPPPPSTTAVVNSDSTDLGEELDDEDASIELVTEITLNFVQSLLTLF